MDKDVRPGPTVELRVHGVSGTPVESVLDDPHPHQVAGDDSGRIFRRNRPVVAELDGDQLRAVEAYHWGRYTAGSPSRALWLLLLPFSLVNLARFALLMPHRRRGRDRMADGVLRLLGLVLTGLIVITACYIGWEVAARQCAAASCAADNAWLRWFVDRSYGVRIVVGALIPAAVVVLIWTFGRQSFSYDPPGPTREWRLGTNGSFDDPGFWRGATQASRQRAAHVWFSCALIGGLALSTMGSPHRWWTGAPPALQVGYVLLLAFVAAGGFTALVLVIGDPRPSLDQLRPDPLGRETIDLPRWISRLRWGMAIVAALCVWLAAAGVDRSLPDLSGSSTVFEVAVDGAGVLAWLLLLTLLVLCAVMAFDANGRRLRGKDADNAAPPVSPQAPGADRAGWRYPAVPRPFRPFWFGFGSWVVATVGVTVGFGFSTIAVFWSAKLLGQPVIDAASSSAVQVRDQQIELAEGYWAAALIWGGLAVLTAVGVAPVLAWLLARRWVLALLLAIAAVGVAAGGNAGYDGNDRLSDQAEYALIAAGLLIAALTVTLTVWRSDLINRLVMNDYSGEEREIRRGAAAVATLWRVAMIRYRYHGVVGAVAVLGVLGITAWAAGGGLVLVRTVAGPTTAPGFVKSAASSVVGTIGVVVVSALATALIGLGLATWRTQRIRTTVGIIWDLLSFWPRVAHPLCPPPYGGRAVLAVAGRCSQLVNDQKAISVVLSGHSQGSVITTAACAVLDEQARESELGGPGDWLAPGKAAATVERLHMVTYGSQLQFAYPRLFPTYLGYFRLKWIYDRALKRRWRNFYRWTDPLGGPVLSWPHAGTTTKPDYGPRVRKWTFASCDDPTACPGHEPEMRPLKPPAGDQPEYRYWLIGPDIRLRDPATVVESSRQPRLPARGHSDYPADQVFNQIVAQLASGSIEPSPSCPPLAFDN